MNHLPNTGKMVSNTPRTDARVRRMIAKDHSPEELKYWARELERELNAAHDRIKRLEEAGDKLAYLTISNGNSHRNWRKAKEAKP